MTATLAFGAWPWTVGCGANARAGKETGIGAAGHAAASNLAGAGSGSSGTAGDATSGGGPSDGGSIGGNAEQGGNTFGGTPSGGNGGSLGGHAGGDEAGANGEAVSCVGPSATFPEFGRSCSTAADCSLVAHTTNCCGTMLVMAIATPETAAFNRAEAICDAQYPACGCAAQGVNVEDGTQVGWSWQADVKASCDSGSCNAHYAGTTFSCATHTCTDKQYCGMSSGGPAGTEPSANCASTTCADCACLKVGTTCSCTVNNGHLIVSCERA